MSSITDKINKLLALAQSSNPHEAALAASRAQELMVKYAIDEAALGDAAESKNEPIETQPMGFGYKRIPKWEPTLLHALSKSFFCRAFYVAGHDAYVVGRASDRAALIATFTYLRNEIRLMADVAWKSQPSEFAVHGKRWKDSFYHGVCITVRDRLGASLKELVADNTGTALVLANKQKEVDDFVAQNHKLRGGNTRTVDSSGFSAGKTAGHALNLNGGTQKQLTA